MGLSPESLAEFFETVMPHLDERQKLVVAGAMVEALGRGGQARAAGASARVSVGDTADTAEFAVESIRRWWNRMSADRFPDATTVLITADAGGSNGYRVRAWKAELAQLAAETGLEITLVHYPPGTSKWNKIEHRMFSFISMNRRADRSPTSARSSSSSRRPRQRAV